jgi:hypothetical protein
MHKVHARARHAYCPEGAHLEVGAQGIAADDGELMLIIADGLIHAQQGAVDVLGQKEARGDSSVLQRLPERYLCHPAV